MKILFNDILQQSNIAKELKSPMLSELYHLASPFIIMLDKERPINSIGIGNTDGTYFDIIFNNGDSFNFSFTGNGLYVKREISNAYQLTIKTNATYIGRIGAGYACDIPTSIAKEPSFNSTSQPRTTLSGQVIQGLGGYNFRTVSLDSRYKIDSKIMTEIQDGYKYIGMGYPFFIDLTNESYKLPFDKLYATERNQRQMSFESGVKRFLYSRRFVFEERF